MGYVTADFYKNTYLGDSIPIDRIQDMLDKASLDIDTLTRMKIKQRGGFESLSSFEQIQVKLAVCSQAEHRYLKASLEGVSSYSIGDISVSMEEASESYGKGCIAYLNLTNLMYRGL